MKPARIIASHCRRGAALCLAGAVAAARRAAIYLALAISLLQLHRAGDRLGTVLRADPLCVAGDRGVLRHRRLYRGGARRNAGMAAGAADRRRDRRADGGDRRTLHAAAQRHAIS